MRRYATLTRAERASYHDTTAGSHHQQLEVTISRRDGTGRPRVLGQVLGWGIDGDLDRTPIEVLTIEVLDEDRELNWTHGEHRHWKVRVTDSRFVPDLDDWVEEVIFTGVLWDFDREGPKVTLIVEGSEMLALGSLRSPFHRPAKAKATEIMRDLLKEAGARNRDLRIPNRKARLPRDVTVGVERGKKHERRKKGPKRRELRLTREDTYFDSVEEIAEALDGDFYCDGLGRFTLTSPRSRPTLFVTESMLLAPVTERPALGTEDAPNTWLVLGANPKGPKDRVSAEVHLPRRHPASAGRMAWNDKPREVTVRIENDKLGTDRECRAVGERARDRSMREVTDYEARLLPVVPWWRPGALVSLPLEGGRRVVARPKRWTVSEEGITLGANRRRGWHR